MPILVKGDHVRSGTKANPCDGWLRLRKCQTLMWPQLFKGWIMLSTRLGLFEIWIAWFVLSTLIHWIAIYPMDSVIQPLNNWDLINNYSVDKC